MTVPSAPQATMHIGAVAEQTGLSLRTLRHYDEVGLLRPSGRTDGGFRLYTEADVDRLLLIRRMKPLGFTLEEMAELLTLVDDLAGPAEGAPHARERLAEYVTRAQEQRAELARKLDMADEFIALLRAR
ncbi:MerR family transcriptional regulator [Cellulomonas sp. DKR-3]|uniref:MerR family transcriptional regulator n=1 Tax=Cellulomonas fulva TaxID=2835530 RepID=A0ABS5TXC7_9CELL|nr:MerR family transcriptional regulator [Cellulomonas fulva]MBT0993756.1 MerR family transcriptional regulator [Cellulomonas fulva]